MASEITPLNATAARSAYDIGDLEASKVRFVLFQKNYGPDRQTHELPSSEVRKVLLQSSSLSGASHRHDITR